MSPREVEDLVSLPCSDCGTYYMTVLGRRDWLARHQPHDLATLNEQEDEVSDLIERARHSAVGRLWQRVKRITSRHDVDEDDEPEEDLESVTATRERIDDPDDTHPTCDNIGNCGGELAISWTQLAAAHDQLTDAERRWLESYTRVKGLIRLGLFTPDVGFRTPLGTFSTKATPALESAYGMIAAGASTQFVASAKLAKLVDALGPDVVLEQMAGDQRCTTAGDDDLILASYFEPPKANVDLDLGLDLAAIAAELRERGATPIRGFGMLRLLDIDWVSVQGKLVYFDFNESLREAVVEHVHGGSW